VLCQFLFFNFTYGDTTCPGLTPENWLVEQHSVVVAVAAVLA